MKKRDLLDHFSQTTSWEFNSSYQKVFKEKYLNQTTALLKKKKFLVCEEFFQNGERAIAALCQKCGHKKIYTGYSYPRECPSCRTKNSGLTLGVIEESNEDFAKILLFNVAPEFTIPPLVVSDPFDCLYSAEVTGAKLVGNYTRFVFSWRYGLFSVPFDSNRKVLSQIKMRSDVEFIKTDALSDFEDRMSDFLAVDKTKFASQINDVSDQVIAKYKKPAVKKSTKIDDLYAEFMAADFSINEKKLHELAGEQLSKSEPLVNTEYLDGYSHDLRVFCPHCLESFRISLNVEENREKPSETIEMTCPNCGKTREQTRSYFLSPRKCVYGYMHRSVNFTAWEKYAQDTLVVRLMSLSLSYDEKTEGLKREISERYRVFITPTRMFLLENSGGKFVKESFTSFASYPYEKRVLVNDEQDLIDMIESSDFKYVGFLEAWGLKGDFKAIDSPASFEKTSYVYTWVKEHCIEQLLKTGFRSIVKDICYNKGRATNLCDKKATSTPKILGVPRPVMRLAASLDASFANLAKINRLYSKDPQTNEDVLRYIINNHIDVSKLEIVFDTLAIPINRQIEYIKTVEQMQCFSPASRVAETWSDYIRMAKECGYKLKDREKRYPSSLIRDHSIISTVYSCIRRDFDQKKFAEMAEINSKFNYSNKELGLFAVAPKTPEEVVNEGMSLHHCVSSYVNPIIMGAAVVLFIRKYEDEETPYYTVEIKQGNPSAIVQVKGDMNTDPDYTSEEGKKIKTFLKKWCNFKGLVLELE